MQCVESSMMQRVKTIRELAQYQSCPFAIWVNLDMCMSQFVERVRVRYPAVDPAALVQRLSMRFERRLREDSSIWDILQRPSVELLRYLKAVVWREAHSLSRRHSTNMLPLDDINEKVLWIDDASERFEMQDEILFWHDELFRNDDNGDQCSWRLIVERCQNGRPWADIAHEWGVEPATLRKRMQSIRVRIKDRMKGKWAAA